MIIMDFSQICIATYMAAVGKFTNHEIDHRLVKHMILDSVRKINTQFRNDYGELVIAVDSPKSWRKEYFPYYKANRAEQRKSIDIDWDALFSAIRDTKNDLIEIFPYKVIEVEGAEADDIIGVLTRLSAEKDEPVVIVSGDGDFIQLQRYSDKIKQWDKVRERWIENADPKRYLFEHVLKGDRGDGIPNILSPNDSLVNKIRQKPMTARRIDSYWDNPQELRNNYRFIENVNLIDLNYTPDEIKDNIMTKYREYKVNDRKNLFEFFRKNNMKKLSQNIGEF